jgi:hypothetical protein
MRVARARRSSLFLEGLIEDDGSQIAEGFSVTNAIVVRTE